MSLEPNETPGCALIVIHKYQKFIPCSGSGLGNRSCPTILFSCHFRSLYLFVRVYLLYLFVRVYLLYLFVRVYLARYLCRGRLHVGPGETPSNVNPLKPPMFL